MAKCTISGVTLDLHDNPIGRKVVTFKIRAVTGAIVHTAPDKATSLDTAGHVGEFSIDLRQGAQYLVEGFFVNIDGGVLVTIPMASTANLLDLVSQSLFPSTGLTVKDEGTALASLIGTINFVGSGVAVTQASSGVATVTISAGAGGSSDWGDIGGTLADQTDLQSALDAKANSSHTHSIANVTGLQTALDTKLTQSSADVLYEAKNANIQNHIANTSNPHSVTKTQIGLGSVDNLQQIPLSYLDTDVLLTANSDVKVPSQKAIKAYADASIAALVNGAPGTLDALNELAAALGNDPNFATTNATALGTKLAKASNLSDLTNAGTARTNLGLAIGSDVQAFNANLSTYAGIAPSANVQTLLGAADYSAFRTSLGLGSLATQSGTFSGTSSGTNTGDQTSVTGNAGTATALQTARAINGVNFDGTANITVTAAAGTLTGTTLNSSVVTSSLTSHGTVTSGGLGAGASLGGVTMSLGSDADGDIYYRASNVLTRLPKGTALQQLRMNAGATAPEWATVSSSGATAALDNLASVAINTALLTGAGVAAAFTATAPSQTTSAQAGANATLTASAAVAGSSNAGAAAGGAVTLTSGNAARLTSGNANGGNINLTTGSGIGTGSVGFVVLPTAGSFLQFRSGGSSIGVFNADPTKVGVFDSSLNVGNFQANTITLSKSVFPSLNVHPSPVATELSILTSNDATFLPVRVATVRLMGLVNTTSDLALTRNGASVAEINNGTDGQWGALKVGTRDAGTNTVTNGLCTEHQSSGTPAAGLGTAILFNLPSSTTTGQNAAQIAVVWTTSTHASRTADIVFNTVNNAAALAQAMRLKGDTRLIVGAPNSAPTDADIANSFFTAYLDESGNKIKFRVRYSDGTLKTAELALT